MSLNGAAFYGLQPNESMITLERIPWQIPAAYSCEPGKGIVVVPFMANERLAWKVMS